MILGRAERGRTGIRQPGSAQGQGRDLPEVASLSPGVCTSPPRLRRGHRPLRGKQFNSSITHCSSTRDDTKGITKI